MSVESDLADGLVKILTPLIRDVVREEVRRAQLQWRWRSVKQAAELLDITENAVRLRCEKGRLPCRKLEGRWYVDIEALDVVTP